MVQPPKTWTSYASQIIVLVALIQIPLTQLRFATTQDGCLFIPDVSTTLDFEDDGSDNTHKVGNHRYTGSQPIPSDLENEAAEKDTGTQPMSSDLDNEAPKKHAHAPQTPPDGKFMNHPIYFRSPTELQSFHSTAHCIGDNFIAKDSWKFKSCQFQNLCFDMLSHDFVTFASPEQLELERVLSNQSLTHFSASSNMLNNHLSLGGLNPKWNAETERLKWFPSLLNSKQIEEEGGIYVLPQDVVMVPFHSFNGKNVGHLLWDDWLPLFTILETFDYLDQEPLFIRYILEEKMWASCDYHKNVEKCAVMMSKFLPLLGVGDANSHNELFTIHEFNFTAGHSEAKDRSTKSKYICGRNGLAGLGMATDHGVKAHGWSPKDYQSSHNMNRAASLYRFRNYMMNNIGVPTTPLKDINKKGKLKIVFSINSSSTGNRKVNFDAHVRHLKRELKDKYDMEIVLIQLAKLKLVEQVELMSTTSILVTMCGGGAVSATFLPKGSALFAFFHDEGGDNKTPARLDWDMFNHISYIRTHWLPRPKKTIKMEGSGTGPQEVDFEAFVKLVDHELDIILHL